MKLGLEVLLSQPRLLASLKGKRVGLVCHPASVNEKLEHGMDLLAKKVNLTCAFGPQHGVRGDKQDNMIESEDFIDPHLRIPIFSLYGQVRRPTERMMDCFDVLIFDLQDLGCRIYTFITSLRYLMEACAQHDKAFVVLDRPNPAGREVEGFSLRPGWESFVGAAPMPMRHGLTVGELALYFKEILDLNLSLSVVKMRAYRPESKPSYGWPADRPWINPSPNAANLNMARAYSGTVLLEGTTLSEGRGTTRPLELMGASDLDFREILNWVQEKAPRSRDGCVLRECFFEPTFHKHQGQLCHGLQVHTDLPAYQPSKFKPFRLVAMHLKAIRELYPKYTLYRDFAYEYVEGKLPFDVINGGPDLRLWLDEKGATFRQLDARLKTEEKDWVKRTKKYRLY